MDSLRALMVAAFLISLLVLLYLAGAALVLGLLWLNDVWPKRLDAGRSAVSGAAQRFPWLGLALASFLCAVAVLEARGGPIPLWWWLESGIINLVALVVTTAAIIWIGFHTWGRYLHRSDDGRGRLALAHLVLLYAELVFMLVAFGSVTRVWGPKLVDQLVVRENTYNLIGSENMEDGGYDLLECDTANILCIPR
jgi:hypothetical protein